MPYASRLLSLAHLTLLHTPPPDLVRVAAAAGFDSVGIRLSPARRGEEPWPMQAGGPMMRETLRALSETGLGVLDVEVLVLYAETDIAEFAPVLEGTARLGARHLLVNVEDPEPSRAAGNLHALGDAAQEMGLSIGLEFMRYRQLKSLQATLDLIADAGGRPKIILDSLHVFRAETDLAMIRTLPADLFPYLQVSDAPAKSPPFELLPKEGRGGREFPGEGGLPLPDLLACLPEDRPLSIEVPRARKLSSDLEEALAAARATRAWLAGLPGNGGLEG